MGVDAVFIPFGKLYGLGVGLRNALYDRSWLRSYDLGACTISIGNITTGGTGKTPLVAVVAEMLADSGENVCILTRGYGRTDPKSRILVSDKKAVLADAVTGGDEPVELARRLIGKAFVVADPDRVSAAHWARDKYGITSFVLDDAFQHRRARRDLDIVCIDATAPFGGERLVPAGRLREPLGGLTRADAFVITRADLSDDTEAIADRLRQYKPSAQVFFAVERIVSIQELGDLRSAPAGFGAGSEEHRQNVSAPFENRVVAFCGLGNPENFFARLRIEGFDVADTVAFPDHHRYSSADIRRLEKLSTRLDAQLITTAKDAVKLDPACFSTACGIAISTTKISPNEEFKRLISPNTSP